MRTPAEAVATAEHFARLHIPVTPNECDHYVAFYYGLAASGFKTAYDHQIQVPKIYRHAFSRTAPAGRLLFYGDRVPGHITLSVGNGNEASTDIGANGFISIDPIGTVPAKWGLPEMFQADPWYGAQGVEVIGVTQVPPASTLTAAEIASEVWIATKVHRGNTAVSALQELANQGTAIKAIAAAVAKPETEPVDTDANVLAAITALSKFVGDEFTALSSKVLTSPVETQVDLTPLQIDAIASAVFAKFQAAVATP